MDHILSCPQSVFNDNMLDLIIGEGVIILWFNYIHYNPLTGSYSYIVTMDFCLYTRYKSMCVRLGSELSSREKYEVTECALTFTEVALALAG